MSDVSPPYRAHHASIGRHVYFQCQGPYKPYGTAQGELLFRVRGRQQPPTFCLALTIYLLSQQRKKVTLLELRLQLLDVKPVASIHWFYRKENGTNASLRGVSLTNSILDFQNG